MYTTYRHDDVVITYYKEPIHTWRDRMKILGGYQRILNTDPIIKHNEQCCICLQNYNTGEYKRILPQCRHLFHKKCIDKWLRVGDGMKCPICRYNYNHYRP